MKVSAISNQLDPRRMQRIRIPDTSLETEVMIYGGDVSDRRPLLILNSIDLPVPPSIDYCEKMWAANYQVIFCRRTGFGNLRGFPDELLKAESIKACAPLATEAAMTAILIKTLNLKNITLMGLGTSNPVCLRLAHLCSEIDFTVFANPLFHPAIWDVIRPGWLRRMIRQTLSSKSGLKIAVSGLRAVLRRDPLWFYRQFAQKSAGDREYVLNNPEDFLQSALLLEKLSAEMFYYDLQMALIEETEWRPELFHGINAVIFSGKESTAAWKRTITNEAARLGLPIVFADKGDLFVPYTSPEALLNTITTHKTISQSYEVKRSQTREFDRAQQNGIVRRGNSIGKVMGIAKK